MTWQTSGIGLMARSAARRAGLAQTLGRLARRSGYETRFHDALLGAVRPGDVVWDVGANVGRYTLPLSKAAGPEGHVYAFEPNPAALEWLHEEAGDLVNVTILPYALGAEPGRLPFEPGSDGRGALSRIATAPREGLIEVAVVAGDAMRGGEAGVPAVIKIDVEGYELEVLRGMRETLRARQLRTVCVEVHFAILEERGVRSGPREVENILRAAGFALTWTDRSHVVAGRNG
jgi:FkbM family methyltransferase